MAHNWKSAALIGGGIAVAAGALFLAKRQQSMQRPAPAKRGRVVIRDDVDLYIDESFPASDAPGFGPTTSLGGTR